MPIPPFTDAGYLPEGIYECTLDEIGERFARFQRTDRRLRLFETLKFVIGDLRRTGMARAIVIDGSFTTAKDEPNDIDLVVELSADYDYAVDLRPFEYNVLTKPGARRMFGFDLFAHPQGSARRQRQIDFFQRIRDDEVGRKGVLRVVL